MDRPDRGNGREEGAPRPPGPEDDREALSSLRRFVLSGTESRIDRAHHSLEDRKGQIDVLARILPVALRMRIRRDRKVERALAGTVETTFHYSVEQNPARIARILSPIVLPAIRKAALDAVKQAVARLNAVLENAFSPRGLLWRVEALVKRKPYAEVLLERTRATGGRPQKRFRVPPLLVVTVALLAYLGVKVQQDVAASVRWNRFESSLESLDGVRVLRAKRDGAGGAVDLLADPYARDPREVAVSLEIDPEQIELNVHLYACGDSDFVLRRARETLKPPAGVHLTFAGETLVVTGVAGGRWRKRARRLALLLPHVRGFDDERLVDRDLQELETLRDWPFGQIVPVPREFPAELEVPASIRELAEPLMNICRLADTQGEVVTLLVRVHGRGLDPAEVNGLSQRWVKQVRDFLLFEGLLASNLRILVDAADPDREAGLRARLSEYPRFLSLRLTFL